MSANVNIDSNADMSGAPSADTSRVDIVSRVRPFYWSVRRELWENRSIYIAPTAVALFVLLSAAISLLRIPEGAVPFQRLLEVSPHDLRIAGVGLYGVIASILGITAGIVGWVYCADALSGERRDRSILFWRSLPVSDVTTVLSKVLIGMVVVPLVALLVGVVLFFLLLIVSSIVLMMNGVSGLLLFASTPFGEAILAHVYLAICVILWGAPLYAWAIFVSSWARRATLLWALTPVVVMLVEGLSLGTRHFMTLIGDRFTGAFKYAFVADSRAFNNGELVPELLPDALLSLLDPVRFLSQPGLWIGLGIAIAFIAASIWMRRYREPL